MNDKIADMKEHAINNEQYSRKSSVRLLEIPEVEGQDSKSQAIIFYTNFIRSRQYL